MSQEILGLAGDSLFIVNPHRTFKTADAVLQKKAHPCLPQMHMMVIQQGARQSISSPNRLLKRLPLIVRCYPMFGVCLAMNPKTALRSIWLYVRMIFHEF